MIRRASLKLWEYALVIPLLFLSPRVGSAQEKPVTNAQVLEAVLRLDAKVEKLDGKVEALNVKVETLHT